MSSVFPKSFSSQFGLKSADLLAYGCFDPNTNVDTKLFIDPLLLGLSQFDIIKNEGLDAFKGFFAQYIKLLAVSDAPNDVAEKGARKLLKFSEIPYTCIGYGNESTRGSGWGPDKQSKFLSVSRQVLKLGMDDPDIFPLLGILESGIGPDLISDMTTNIILNQLCEFTQDVCLHFSIPTKKFNIKAGVSYMLPENPDSLGKPIILIPMDILRDLPAASSWGDVYDLASQTDEIRTEVNKYLGKIIRDTMKDHAKKLEIKAHLMQNKEALKIITDFLRGLNNSGYDFKNDPKGMLLLKRLFELLPAEHPIDLPEGKITQISELIGLARKICNQFVFLIEKRGFWRELYIDDKPAPESKIQKLFYVVALSYCKDLDVDINAESETGDGKIDFKLSIGYSKKLIIEIKWSKNSKLVSNYTEQTKRYAESEEAEKVFYVVVDNGHPKRIENLIKKKNALTIEGVATPEIVIADATKQEAPSKG